MLNDCFVIALVPKAKLTMTYLSYPTIPITSKQCRYFLMYIIYDVPDFRFFIHPDTLLVVPRVPLSSKGLDFLSLSLFPIYAVF